MNLSKNLLSLARSRFAVIALGGAVVGLTTWLWTLGDSGQTQASVAVVEQANRVVRDVAPAHVGAGTGSLSGQITYKGDAPVLPPKVVKGDATVKDPAVCGAQNIPDESLVVNPKNNGIANVFVYLQKAPAGFKAAVPAAQIKFDQKGCTFIPHCVTVHTGQTLLVLNSDPIVHNTHTFPPAANPGFNQAVSANNVVGVPLVYAKPERLPVSVKCDFHSWMSAYQVVQNHPFCAVTDADGKFEIKDLPAGTHEFTIWQERAGYLDRKKSVVVTDGQAAKLQLDYAPSKFTTFIGPRPKQVLVSFSE